MSADETELLRLALLAHESASDRSVWPQFLERCARAIGADVMLLQRHRFSAHHSHAIATFGMARQFTDDYNEYYSKLNVWRDNGRGAYVTGRVVFDRQLYPRRLLKRTEFYNDCLAPNRVTHSLAGVIDRQGDAAVVLTGLRGEPRDEFADEVAKTLEPLLPHLSRAFVTQERLHALEGGEHALNALSFGVVLLASDARVVFSNRAADEMLRSEDGLAMRKDRLAAASSETDAALQRMLQYAVVPGESMECPADVLVMRPSGRRPYHVIATPLRRQPAAFVGVAVPVALVLIRDPERQRPIAADTLKQAYGLTSREAALALTLAEGEALQQVADRLGMQYETARTHLRRILSKTGTSRQAGLIALLERLSVHLLDNE